MKNVLYLATLATIIFSCNKSENKKKLNEEQIQAESYKNADFELESYKEKIALLSIIKNIPTDSLYLVIREYYSKTECLEGNEYEDNYNYTKIVNAISLKLKMPENKIANLIYDFKYEMITKEDVENQLIEESKRDNEPF